MVLTFYPHPDDTQKGSVAERVDLMMESAERFKAVVLDLATRANEAKIRVTPRDQIAAYNWEEIARVLREVREMPEISKPDKIKKATLLTKLAEVYEILRAAKMPKLEAVRLALIAEANQLKSSAAQVA